MQKRIVLFGIIFSLFLSACGKRESDKPATKPPVRASNSVRQKRPHGGRERAVVSMPVEVAFVVRRDMKDYIVASTTLEALREVKVFAKTSGLVTSLFVEEGDRVMAGDTLLVIDDREARLNLKKARIAYREARNAKERSEQMKARNLISDEEYESTQLSFERAETELESAKLTFEYTRVTAPISGYIVERMVELGGMVTTGKALFRLGEFNPLRARVYVPEKELNRVRIGQDAILTIESEPGRVFYGRVELISTVVDPSSGTFKVTIRVDSTEGILRPGMFAGVRIVVDEHSGTLAVPKQAIIYEGDKRFIYVVHGGIAKKVEVETGFSDEGYVEVVGELNEGEPVVVAGQNNLASGMKVEVVNSSHQDSL